MSSSLLSVMICCAVSTAAGVLIGRGRWRPRMIVNLLNTDQVPKAARWQDGVIGETCPKDQTPELAWSKTLTECWNSKATIESGACDTSSNRDSEAILAANVQLQNDNRQLQIDLDAARLEIQRQQELMSECLVASRTDSLTRIANRRAFDYELTRMVALLRREGTTFAVVMLDIDHFKRINDQYGHLVGDHLLRDFAQILLRTFRASDFVARFGGEEFVAILPNCTIDEACVAADRVRRIVSSSQIKVGDLNLRVTASFGVKQMDELESESEFLERTDSALYAAKRNGRDCCYYHLKGECCHYDSPSGVARFDAASDDEISFGNRLGSQIDGEFAQMNLAAIAAQSRSSQSLLV